MLVELKGVTFSLEPVLSSGNRGQFHRQGQPRISLDSRILQEWEDVTPSAWALAFLSILSASELINPNEGWEIVIFHLPQEQAELLSDSVWSRKNWTGLCVLFISWCSQTVPFSSRPSAAACQDSGVSWALFRVTSLLSWLSDLPLPFSHICFLSWVPVVWPINPLLCNDSYFYRHDRVTNDPNANCHLRGLFCFHLFIYLW